ncbi:MAG: glycosyltransferase family 9 protein [Deltaproteobacteria bacterium]|nr:glycosyltransferase family 9 protein [Deltaproteobacteria bacterium]
MGNVVCTALATAKDVTAPFRRPVGEIRNIVVMKFFGMGSIVVATPAIAALRDQFPGAKIHFVTFKSNRELLGILGLTDHEHYIDPSTPASFTRSTLAVIRALRAARCELAVDLEFFAKFPLTLASLAGIPKKAGFYLQSEAWRRKLLDVSGIYNHYFHTKDIFLSLPYMIATEDPYFLRFNEWSARYHYPRIRPSELERAALRKKLAPRIAPSDPIFVINANTSPDLAPEARKWPEARYAELADRLLHEHPRAKVLFTGARSEKPYVERIVAACTSRRAFSVAGELSLRELLVLFAETSLFVSNDSGPMHLACLVDAPIVGLFFGDSPTLFAPVGTRVRSVAPPLYSIPLFTVYNGKDITVGRKASEISNAVACTVSVDDVMIEVNAVLVPQLAAMAAPQ